MLARRAFANAATGMVAYGVKMLVVLMVTPILVSAFGRSLYGTWEILNRLVLYLSPVVECPMYVLQLHVAEQHLLDTPDLKRRYVAHATAIGLIGLCLALVAGAVVVWKSPSLTQTAGELDAIVRVTCALLLVRVILDGLLRLPSSALSGMNLGYRGTGLQAAFGVLAAALMVAAVRAGWGMRGVAAGQAAAAAIAMIALWWLTRRCVDWFRSERPRLRGGAAFVRMSLWNFGSGTIAVVQSATDVVILGLLSSTAIVSQYALTDFAARSVFSVAAFSLVAVAPGIGGLIGQRQFAKARQLRAELIAGVWCVATAVGGTLLLWNRSFVSLWVGPEFYAGMWANLFITLRMLQGIMREVDVVVIDSALRLPVRVAVNSVAVVVSIGMAMLLTPRWQIPGLCLGLISGRLIQTIMYPRVVRECLWEERVIPSSRPSLIRPTIATIALFGAAAYLGDQVLVRGWIACLGGGAVSILLLTGGAAYLGLPGSARQSLMARVRRLTSRQLVP